MKTPSDGRVYPIPEVLTQISVTLRFLQVLHISHQKVAPYLFFLELFHELFMVAHSCVIRLLCHC